MKDKTITPEKRLKGGISPRALYISRLTMKDMIIISLLGTKWL